jgi:hypothetical protein
VEDTRLPLSDFLSCQSIPLDPKRIFSKLKLRALGLQPDARAQPALATSGVEGPSPWKFEPIGSCVQQRQALKRRWDK